MRRPKPDSDLRGTASSPVEQSDGGKSDVHDRGGGTRGEYGITELAEEFATIEKLEQHAEMLNAEREQIDWAIAKLNRCIPVLQRKIA